MRIVQLLFIEIIIFAEACKAWEYCRNDIQEALCGTQKHFVCDLEHSSSKVVGRGKKPTSKSTYFLAHVPLTRKVKMSFLNWHNYFRNRTAGGWAKNKKKINFPNAVRMRELIWDSELSFLSHVRTKFVSDGEIGCGNTQRFPKVTQNLIVTAANETRPVLEVIASSLRKMFFKKNFVEDPITLPKSRPKDNTKANQFIIMINDHVSRLGCAVALGEECKKKGSSYKYCYYTACTYDADNEGSIYKVGKPARRCSKWEVGRSKTYSYLCANSGKIFKQGN